MLELNDKTQQDFLNREWVQKLLDAGVDMSDAKYCIVHTPENKGDMIVYDSSRKCFREDYTKLYNVIPTYTVSELLNKLHERHGIYTIFNSLRNNNIDNIPIIESLATLLIQYYNKDIKYSK